MNGNDFDTDAPTRVPADWKQITLVAHIMKDEDGEISYASQVLAPVLDSEGVEVVNKRIDAPLRGPDGIGTAAEKQGLKAVMDSLAARQTARVTRLSRG